VVFGSNRPTRSIEESPQNPKNISGNFLRKKWNFLENQKNEKYFQIFFITKMTYFFKNISGIFLRKKIEFSEKSEK
jgi:hypothetical protein